jgi:hypothetical protein
VVLQNCTSTVISDVAVLTAGGAAFSEMFGCSNNTFARCARHPLHLLPLKLPSFRRPVCADPGHCVLSLLLSSACSRSYARCACMHVCIGQRCCKTDCLLHMQRILSAGAPPWQHAEALWAIGRAGASRVIVRPYPFPISAGSLPPLLSSNGEGIRSYGSVTGTSPQALQDEVQRCHMKEQRYKCVTLSEWCRQKR